MVSKSYKLNIAQRCFGAGDSVDEQYVRFYMKKSIVSPSFLKQKARNLKKEKSLSHSQALDEVAREYGYSNYKNYLNILDANSKKSMHPEILLKNLSSENDLSKKVALTISFIKDFKIPFHEQLDILKFFQHSHELGQHPDFEWLDDVHFVSEKLNLMNDEIQQYLLDDFLTDEGIAEIHFMQPHFKAKEVSLSELTYELDRDMLVVDGQYNLKTEFEFEMDEDDPISKDKRFNDREVFGSFGVNIDRNKKITITHSSITEENGGIFFRGSFRKD